MANEIVLYVEDEENDVIFMKMAFSHGGLAQTLRTVKDGGEAIHYLSGQGAYADREHNPMPRAVLLDLNLPVVSGFEVLKWIGARAELADLPVLIFSSSSRDEDKKKALELGAVEFWEKPNSALQFRDIAQKLAEEWLGVRYASPDVPIPAELRTNQPENSGSYPHN